MIYNDGSGQSYVEVATSKSEAIRLTFIPAAKAGYGRDSVRIQIKGGKGNIRPGPELPVDCLGRFLGAFTDLLGAFPTKCDNKLPIDR
jgi:hypothetical protein